MGTDYSYFEFASIFAGQVFTTLLQWFQKVYNAVDMFDLWIGIVVFVAVFSIVVMPLRGGADLTHGVFGSFLMNKVNKHKRHDD